MSFWYPDDADDYDPAWWEPFQRVAALPDEQAARSYVAHRTLSEALSALELEIVPDDWRSEHEVCEVCRVAAASGLRLD